MRRAVKKLVCSVYTPAQELNSITLSGSKLVADLQRAEIWLIIELASSELARASRSADRFESKFHYAIWFEAGSTLVADRFEAGRGPASSC